MLYWQKLRGFAVIVNGKVLLSSTNLPVVEVAHHYNLSTSVLTLSYPGEV